MRQELSSEEIEKLFQFVKSKCVRYLDVQHEIVDHLASAIEEKQSADPNLSFDNALKQVYAGFPITGFASIIDSKQKAIFKYWINTFLKFILQYFKPPLVFTLVTMTYIFQLILSHPNESSRVGLYFLVLAFLIGSSYYRNYLAFKLDQKQTFKYLITTTYRAILEGSSFFIMIPMTITSVLFVDGSWIVSSPIIKWSISFIWVLIIFWIHAMSFEFPKILKQELKEKYTHLKLA